MIKSNNYIKYIFEQFDRKKILNISIRNCIDQIYYKDNIYKLIINSIIDKDILVYMKKNGFFLESENISESDNISSGDFIIINDLIKKNIGLIKILELKNIILSSRDIVLSIGAFFVDIILQIIYWVD